jgi:hypothetical protein
MPPQAIEAGDSAQGVDRSPPFATKRRPQVEHRAAVVSRIVEGETAARQMRAPAIAPALRSA